MMLVRAPTLIFDHSLSVSVIATHRESVVSLNRDRADAQVDQHRDVDFKPGGAGHPDVRENLGIDSALRRSTKVTAVLLFRCGAPRKSLRFYGCEADE